MKPEEVLDIELFPGSKFAQRIICKLCGEEIFRSTGNETQGQIDTESKGVGTHLEFRHGIEFRTFWCSDPNCLEGH